MNKKGNVKENKITQFWPCILFTVLAVITLIVMNRLDEKNKPLIVPISTNAEDKTIKPIKGNLIVLENDDSIYYRVLKIEGSEALLLRMNPLEKKTISKTLRLVEFEDGKTYQQYDGCETDSYLNQLFYDTDDVLKSAIIRKDIIQNAYASIKTEDQSEEVFVFHYNDFSFPPEDKTKRFLAYVSSVNVGERYMYLPDIKDIYEYFGKNELSSADINYFFYNTYEKIDEGIWLRSVRADQTEFFVTAGGLYGDFVQNSYGGLEQVRPLLTVDLNKITYTEYNSSDITTEMLG